MSVRREDVRASLLPHWPADWGPLDIACDDGWLELIASLHREIVTLAPGYRLREVSQKYGELYFRVEDIDEPVDAAIDAAIERARERSLHLCETCGAAGQLSRDQDWWLEVRCAAHSEGYVPVEE